MLDEDNDGEVSLGDITRAVFRRAPDRDLNRIRRFLEVRLAQERTHLVYCLPKQQYCAFILFPALFARVRSNLTVCGPGRVLSG